MAGTSRVTLTHGVNGVRSPSHCSMIDLSLAANQRPGTFLYTTGTAQGLLTLKILAIGYTSTSLDYLVITGSVDQVSLDTKPSMDQSMTACQLALLIASTS